MILYEQPNQENPRLFKIPVLFCLSSDIWQIDSSDSLWLHRNGYWFWCLLLHHLRHLHAVVLLYQVKGRLQRPRRLGRWRGKRKTEEDGLHCYQRQAARASKHSLKHLILDKLFFMESLQFAEDNFCIFKTF